MLKKNCIHTHRLLQFQFEHIKSSEVIPSILNKKKAEQTANLRSVRQLRSQGKPQELVRPGKQNHMQVSLLGEWKPLEP